MPARTSVVYPTARRLLRSRKTLDRTTRSGKEMGDGDPMAAGSRAPDHRRRARVRGQMGGWVSEGEEQTLVRRSRLLRHTVGALSALRARRARDELLLEGDRRREVGRVLHRSG